MPNEEPILALQREYNRRTRESWASYGEHRRRVTDLLLAARSEFGPRLCVLGAGNCNDLELSELTQAYDEIRLVDLDGEAMEEGVFRQRPARAERITLAKGCDLSGAAAIIAHWRPARPASDEEVNACLKILAMPVNFPAAIGTLPFDVVASTCLLTQFIESLRTTVGADHPRFLELVLAVRRRHWRLLASLGRTGARAILITDFVSSDTAPEIVACNDGEIRFAASRLLGQSNFFTGANPLSLRQELLDDPTVSERFTNVELLTPWRWRLESRAYFVAAVRAIVR